MGSAVQPPTLEPMVMGYTRESEDSIWDEMDGWKACRLVDERTGNSLIGVDFPRRQRGAGFETFDADLAEQPERIRIALKRYGAALYGSIKEQGRLIRRVLKANRGETQILAKKP